MRLAANSPDRLVLDEGVLLQTVVGGMFVLLGLVVLVATLVDGGPARASDFIIAGLGVVLGAAAIVFFPHRRAEFDRAAGVVHLTTWIGARTRTREIALTDIVAVMLEHAMAGTPGPTVYLPALVLRSGERVPLMVSATGFLDTERRITAQVQQWLALPPATALPPRPVSAAHRRASILATRAGRAGLRVMTVAAALVALLGVDTLLHQRHVLGAYQPVEAIVISAAVDTFPEHPTDPWGRPVIRYRYTMNGSVFESSRFAPLPIRRPAAWADSVARRFVPQSEVTAYADPRHPQLSYLVPYSTYSAVDLVAVAMLIAFLGVWELRHGPGRRLVPPA